MNEDLPIDDALPELCAAMAKHGRAVLQAPPGAGKTTRVPLALLEAGAFEGRMIMLEPRRLAARGAAERMAETLGEAAGETVGYRMRGASKVSKNTRIEVVTEGVLTRMLQSDPALDGVGAVVFDEFHERSLNADLGLALALESCDALRDDLQILVMSATLDAAPVATLLADAPIVTSRGRSFPIETLWRDVPLPDRRRPEAEVADTVLRALDDHEGGVLVFLPGQAEIRRSAAVLSARLPENTVLHELHGGLPFAAQRAAVRPDPERRKVVLSTAIAETSLTISDVRVVIDAGLARRARYDPGSGMTRLVTERVSRAEADQRRGRAGRVAPGICYRLWTKGEDGGFPTHAPAEIETADLAGFALELAAWGARDASELPLLTQPPEGTMAEARALLSGLEALDKSGAITAHGRDLAKMPIHPRLAHMLTRAGKPATTLAALLSVRDPLHGAGADLTLRLDAITGRRGGADKRAIEAIQTEAKRLGAGLPNGTDLTPAQMAALAYPDRIGLRRKGDNPRWVLSGGKGVAMPPDDALAGARLIVVTDTDGQPREARIRQAIEISEAEIRELFAAQIVWRNLCRWDKRTRRIEARQQERFGALVLQDRIWKGASDDDIARAMLDGVRDLGLRFSAGAERFRARVSRARTIAPDLPDMSDAALLSDLENWLLPHLSGVRNGADWEAFDPLPALRAMLTWDQSQTIDRLAPPHYETPLGRKVPIDYASNPPEISLRLQEVFGETRHPMIGDVPLRLTLLSPAGRPVQTTTDLPGFWSSSYADVRKDMRGRYPKHPWPEDPTQADPTLRAKRRS